MMMIDDDDDDDADDENGDYCDDYEEHYDSDSLTFLTVEGEFAIGATGRRVGVSSAGLVVFVEFTIAVGHEGVRPAAV